MLCLAEAGQVGVKGGDVGAVVTEVDLDLAEVLAAFEQMSGVGMAQGVDVSVLFDAAGFKRQTKGPLQRGALDGLGGGGGIVAAVALAREEQLGVVVSSPLLAQQIEGACGKGHVAIAIALAAADVQEHALGIDVGHAQVEAFAQAQAAGVNGGEADAMIQSGDVREDAVSFGLGEDDREFKLEVGANELDFGGPGAFEGLFPEEFDGADGLCGSLSGDFFVALEMDEVLAQFFGGGQLRGFGEVVCQLAHASQVSLLSAGQDADQLEVVGE